MFAELFQITLQDLTLKVKYDEEENYFLCEFNDGEQQHTISQNHRGDWYEIEDGYTTMARQLGKIIEAKIHVKLV
jgi:hypothetical protein